MAISFLLLALSHSHSCSKFLESCLSWSHSHAHSLSDWWCCFFPRFDPLDNFPLVVAEEE